MGTEGVTTGLAFAHAADNLGDLAINHGVARVLELSGASVDSVSYLSLAARSTADQIGAFERHAPAFAHVLPRSTADPLTRELDTSLATLEYLADPGTWLRDAAMEDVEAIVVNGGEHFFSDTVHDNSIALINRVVPVIAALHSGKNIAVAPSTLGPSTTSVGREVFACLAQIGPRLAVREPRSFEWARRNGLRVAGPHLDPAFFLPPKDVSPAADRGRILGIAPRLEGYGMRSGPRRSAHALARARGSGFQQSTSFAVARELAGRRIRMGWEVRLIIQTPNDLDLCSALVEDLRTEFDSASVRMVQPPDLESYRESLAELTALVSARFHASVLAWGVGTPSVGYFDPGHGHKMPALYEMLERESDVVDASATDPVSSATILDSRLDAVGTSIGEVEQRVERARVRTQDWWRRVLDQAPPRSAIAQERRDRLAHEIASTVRSELVPRIATAVAVRQALDGIQGDVRTMIDRQT